MHARLLHHRALLAATEAASALPASVVTAQHLPPRQYRVANYSHASAMLSDSPDTVAAVEPLQLDCYGSHLSNATPSAANPLEPLEASPSTLASLHRTCEGLSGSLESGTSCISLPGLAGQLGSHLSDVTPSVCVLGSQLEDAGSSQTGSSLLSLCSGKVLAMNAWRREAGSTLDEACAGGWEEEGRKRGCAHVGCLTTVQSVASSEGQAMASRHCTAAALRALKGRLLAARRRSVVQVEGSLTA